MSQLTRRHFALGTAAALSAAWAPVSRGADARAPSAPLGFAQRDGYRLVKNWDFCTTITDERGLHEEFHTRYVYDQGKCDHFNDEWSRYRDNRNHVFTPRGLSLTARLVGPLAQGQVESGMLRSRWTGVYGVYEIRMRAPRARGMWPAFWLVPQDAQWPPEIDVVEIVNNGRDTTRDSFHFVHGIGAKNARTHASKLGGNHAYSPKLDYAADHHVFAAEWSEGRVRHFVDGALIVDRDYQWKHSDGSWGGAAHVLVNLAVGGKWPGPPLSADAFPASLDIDYIRVWQR